MSETQNSEIRFFSFTGRIGRLRYLAYPLGLTLLLIPLLIIAVLLGKLSSVFVLLIMYPAYAAVIVLNVGFMVRRLHDFDVSGWWALLMLVPLVNVILTLVLLFKAGNAGDNRFGAPPPPNSAWVIAGAWTYVGMIPLAGIIAAIAIPAYQDFVCHAQAMQSHVLAEQARTAAVDYYVTNEKWPDDVTKVSDVLPASSLSDRYTQGIAFRNPGQGTFAVIATMKQQGVARPLQNKSFEIWTTDDGSTWHCGPGGNDPAPARYLSPDCHDGGAPR